MAILALIAFTASLVSRWMTPKALAPGSYPQPDWEYTAAGADVREHVSASEPNGAWSVTRHVRVSPSNTALWLMPTRAAVRAR